MVPGKELGVGITRPRYFQPRDHGPVSHAPLRVRGPPSREGASHLLPQHDSPQRRACLGLRKARALPAAPPIHTLHPGLCRVGDRSGWAGRELGLMHVSELVFCLEVKAQKLTLKNTREPWVPVPASPPPGWVTWGP